MVNIVEIYNKAKFKAENNNEFLEELKIFKNCLKRIDNLKNFYLEGSLNQAEQQYKELVRNAIYVQISPYILYKFQEQYFRTHKTLNDTKRLFKKSLEFITVKDNCFEIEIDDVVYNNQVSFGNIPKYIRFINKVFELNIPCQMEYYRDRQLNVVRKINEKYSYIVTEDQLIVRW